MTQKSSHRILHLLPSLQIGGLERMVLTLITSLSTESKFNFSVVAFNPESEQKNSIIFELERLNIPLKIYQKTKNFSLRVILKIYFEVVRNKIDTIHTHTIGALMYASFVKILTFGRIRIINTQHSFIHLEYNKRYAFYERYFSWFADEITVVSKDLKDIFIALGVNSDKISIIPNGVQFPEQPTLDPSKIRSKLLLKYTKELQEKFSDKMQKNWILYLARIFPKKGQDHAISIWNKLSESIRDQSVLVFVGPASSTEELKKLQDLALRSVSSENIIFAGETDEPLNWIEATDIFLSCSESEGMPLAPLEAIGSGISTLLSDIKGHDCFNHLAERFLLSSIQDGSNIITTFINNGTRDSNRMASWNKAADLRKKYSIKSMAKSFLEIYLNQIR